jgi:saccharopine dehydrogenase-like NADP-dependent oxidoreductase
MHTMRCVVLGGAGGMGATACRHLAAAAGVGELVVADRDGERAARVAAGLAAAPARVTSRAADLLDAAATRALLAGADLVLNCAGPFFRLGVPTLEAALAAGTPYVDICDDPEPTLAMLALDEAARRAGVFAVIGMGASPGLSNLLAQRAARRLDRVTDCFTVWPLDGASGQNAAENPRAAAAVGAPPSAAAVHLMEQISGRIRVIEDGRIVQRAPLEAVALDYLGAGAGTAYTVGHPEPLTLVRTLRVLGRCANLMLLRPSTAAYLHALRGELDRGTLTREAAAAKLLAPPAGGALLAAARGLAWPGAGSLPPFFALLTGERAGRRLAVGCHVTSLPAGMDGATAIPAALGAAQLLRAPPPPGVHPPDAAIDGEALLAALAPLCPGAPESADALAPVVERDLGPV